MRMSIIVFLLHSFEKNGKQMTKMVSYCAYHRVPDPGYLCFGHTEPFRVFSTKSMLRSKTNIGSRLISSRINEVPQI
ncbi:hypothetical protein Scep_026564 [Stephania cephalantha]|uniref:Uncharacterized protein n=1 Tax=Stephania cephalantha TaxID=152367 RepID=A0AAP0EKD4_9MAGN